MSVDLQPLETFAFASRESREQQIRDQHVSGSQEYTFKMLKHTQTRIMEAKERNQPTEALLAEEVRLMSMLNDNWFRTQTEGMRLILRDDLLLLDREMAANEGQIKSQEAIEALERFRQKLNVEYGHYVQQLPSYETDNITAESKPSKLDEKEMELTSVLKRHKDYFGLGNLRQLGWEWIAHQELSRTDLASFLQQVKQPVLSNTVELVLRELNEPIPTYNASNPTREVVFGETNLHRLLTFEQLEELKKRKPELWSNRTFVSDYILKNRPFVSISEWEEPESNGGLADSVKKAYLEKLWQDASALELTHVAVKGLVFFHVLYYSMELFNELDMAKFQTYLELPRSDSSSNCLKYRSEEVLGFNKLSSAEKIVRRAELFAPSSNSIACPSGIANIFTKFSSANESALVEFALIKNLNKPSFAVNDFEAAWKDWFSYLSEYWAKRIVAREVLTTPSILKSLASNQAKIEEFKALLGNDELNRLKNQIKLEFGSRDKSVRNARYYTEKQSVNLNVLLKNVPALLVKIFYIHARNFYTKRGEEIDASNLELDGLTPKEEIKLDITKEVEGGVNWNEFLVVEKRIALDSISKEKRGVFVVELLGAGYRARCIIRKGSLLALSNPTAQGHAFRIVDEETSTPINGSIFLNGQTYNSDPKTGFLLIPYSASPNSNQKIVLIPSNESASASSAGVAADTTFATLSTFSHLSEQYTFSANFYLDRESLLSKTRASVLIKANLRIHDNIVNVERNLKKVVLRIDTTDDEDVPSTQIVDPFQLFADKESLHTFTVADNLKRLQFTLSGEVTKFSNGEKQQVSESFTIDLNMQDSTHFTEDLFLKYGSGSKVRGGSSSSSSSSVPAGGDDDEGEYVLYALGKSGEPIRNRQIQLTFQHEYVNSAISGHSFTEVATDENGCVRLGKLTHINELVATPVGTSSVTTPSRHHWSLSPAPQSTHASYVHANRKRNLIIQAGEAISIPYTGRPVASAAVKSGEFFYLVEDLGSMQLGKNLTAAHVDLVYTATEKALQITGLKAGHYLLLIKQSLYANGGQWHTYNIHAVEGKVIMNEYLLDKKEKKIVQLEKNFITGTAENQKKSSAKLQIVDVKSSGDAKEKGQVIIQLNGVTPSTRVHVISANFYPDLSLLNHFTGAAPPESRVLLYKVTASSYLKQKMLGDEVNYILDRKLAGDRIGNMLSRPSLFLHDRVKQDTQFAADPTLSAGESYSSADVAAAEVAHASASAFGYGGPSAGAMPMSSLMHRKVAYSSRMAENFSSDDGAGSVGIVSFDGGEPIQRHNFEFLSQPSKLLANLRPDAAAQTVKIDLSEFDATHNVLSIIAVDSQAQLASFQYGLKNAGEAQYDDESKEPENQESLLKLDVAFRDSRLMPPLDSNKHYSEHHLISVLQRGESLVIEDVKTSTIETYDTLKDVWNLIQIIAKNTGEYGIIGTLQKFEWLLRWFSLSQEEQDEKYSEFACHELNLFLQTKDAPFFERVIKPFLANKLAKTFMDIYLLNGDVSGFLAPHSFGVLNTLEKILLAYRLTRMGGAENKAKAIAILELIIQTTNAQIKDDPDAFLAYFKTALQSKSLSKKEGDDDEASNGLLAKAAREGRKERKEKALAQQQLQPQQEKEQAPMRSRATMKPMAMAMASSSRAPMPPSMSAAPMPSMAAPCPPPAPGGRAMLRSAGLMADAEEECDMPSDGARGGGGSADFDSFADQLDSGELQARKLFQEPPSTKEYEERTYYEISSSDLGEATEPVRINRFWGDYASFLKALWSGAIDAPQAFLTRNLGESLQSFTEVVARLIVLDLPLPNQQQAHEITGSREKSMKIKAGSPVIVFHKEMKQVTQEASSAAASSSAPGGGASNSISISANYFDPFDLFVEGSSDGSGDSERTDRFVTEFLTRKIYGCRVVLTNVSSNKQRVEVLLQIPSGSMPVGSNYKKGLSTTTRFVEISSYSSTVITYLFYFPTTGLYPHYPPSATKKGKSVGFGAKNSLRVVAKPTTITVNLLDWKQISQSGSEGELLKFLNEQNLVKLDLSLMCWRFNPPRNVSDRNGSNEKLWKQVIKILKARLIYDNSVWSFAFLFQDTKALSELFQRSAYVLSQLGSYFNCSFLRKDIADYEFNEYQHLEYSPLLNARAHTLRTAGNQSENNKKKLTIQNVQFSNQYRAFLTYLSDRVSGSENFTPNHKLCLVYYLLLQDRINEAKTLFDTIPAPVREDADSSSSSASSSKQQGSVGLSSPTPTSCALQYDYFCCYFDFFNAVPSVALSIAKKYSNHPVHKKRKLFEEVMNQFMEISSRVDPSELEDEFSKDPLNRTKDAQDRDRELANLAASEPSLDFNFVSVGELEISYENVGAIQVHLYQMNIELMFSANPFIIAEAGASGHGMHSGGGDKANAASFLYVTPNDTITLSKLPQNTLTGPKKAPLVVKLPEQYRRTNCWVEVTNSGAVDSAGKISAAGAGGISVVKPHFANQLSVQVIANYGQVKVSHSVTGKPLPSTYVKVFCKPKDGSAPSFYKDCYTDLRGRADIASLSTDKLKTVSKFAILVLHEEFGAACKIAEPPQV